MAALLFGTPLHADKLSFDERMEIERGLDSEFATTKVILPRARRPLQIQSNGTYDRDEWQKAQDRDGIAAHVGDEIQITRVMIEEKRIVLQINGGSKSHARWRDHVQVGVGGQMAPVATNQNTQEQSKGSQIEVVFPGPISSMKSSDIRQMLAQVLDFEKHSAAEQYADKLPEPMKKAIQEQRAIEGMDRDQVLMALGKPNNKSRETNADGDELEDWIYGQPPGKMTFITFNEGKVVTVKYSYADVGGSTAPSLPPVR